MPGAVPVAHDGLRGSVALCRGLQVPLYGLRVILPHPESEGVHAACCGLCLRKALLRGLQVPAERRLLILLYALSGEVQVSEAALRHSVSEIGGLPEPSGGLLRILPHAEPGTVHAAEVAAGPGAAQIRSLPEPLRGPLVILERATAVKALLALREALSRVTAPGALLPHLPLHGKDGMAHLIGAREQDARKRGLFRKAAVIHGFLSSLRNYGRNRRASP